MNTSGFYRLMLLALFLVQGIMVWGQEEKKYKAIIIDSLDKMPVEKVTVSLSGKAGPITKVSTNDDGYFATTVKADSVLLLLQHVGYSEKRQVILLSELQEKTDTIILSPLNQLMDDIVIRTAVPPIVTRGDTTEYHIDSAMFEPFDVVQDLIRRLPGLEIDDAGKMTFHGKPITRILVDGEDLFGGDATFSLNKLPAGMVAKIQVMDTKTLEQLFEGTPSDGEDKTLNIKLRSGTKTFGSGEALAGTKNQLEGNFTLSQFDEGKRLSMMGAWNSSNEIGLPKIWDGPSSSSANASVNYGTTLGKVRINSNYGYNHNGNTNAMYRERTQVITADTSFFSQSRNLSNFRSGGHRLSLNNNWEIDTTSTMEMNLSFSSTNSKSESASSSITTENGSLRNESYNSSLSTGNYQTLSSSLNWMKRLKKRGRTLSVQAKTNLADQSTGLLSQSTNTYFKTGLPVNGDTLHRQTTTANDIRNYGISISYAEPITKALRLTLRGDIDYNRSSTDRDVYNLDSVSHTAQLDSFNSARIISSTLSRNINTGIAYTTSRWNVNAGLATLLQQVVRTLHNDDIRQDLLRYSPSVNASFFITKAKVLRANFTANTIQPSIEQIQPVPDNSNPLYVRVGNPNLLTAFAQNYGLSYNYFNLGNAVSMSLGYSPVNNQIVNAVFYDEYRRQTSQFINVNGVYTARGNLSVTKTKMKDKKTTSWTAASGFSYGQQVYFQSSSQYYTRNYSVNGSLSFAKREQVARGNNFTVTLGGAFGRNWTPANTRVLNTTKLSLIPQANYSFTLFDVLYSTASYRVTYHKFNYHSALRRNDEYSIHAANTELRLRVRKQVSVQTTLLYQYNTRVPEGTSKGVFTCNLSASAQLWKGKGNITLAAYDLSTINSNLRRVVGENYIEDVQMSELRNYFSLRLQYNFSRLLPN